MVQSVTGQAVVAPVDQAVGDGASVPSANGTGAAFDLTGLLDTVSANAELIGVSPTDAPPAALAVAALKANAGLAVASVSKPLDVTSLSSVDAGLASLLMLKQTVSKGLVASAEPKMPVPGKAGDLANISLTLKLTPQPLEMAPLVPVAPPAYAEVQIDPATGEVLQIPVEGQAEVHPDAVDLPPVSGEGQVVASEASVNPDLKVAQSEDAAILPAADTSQTLALDEQALLVVVDPSVAPLAPEAVIADPSQTVVAQPVVVDAKQDAAGGFKIALNNQVSSVAIGDQDAAVVTAPAHDGSGLGVLNVAPETSASSYEPAPSIMAGLTASLKSMSKDVATSMVKGVSLADVSGPAAVAAGAVDLTSSAMQGLATGQVALASAKSGLSDTKDEVSASDQLHSDKDGVVTVHGHGQGGADLTNTHTPIIGAASVDAALQVQQQAVIGAQIQVQQAAHNAAHLTSHTVASMTGDAVAGLQSGPVNTKVQTASSLTSNQTDTAVSNSETILAEQLVVQRQTDSRDAFDQQSSNRQFDQQLADKRVEDEAGLKSKSGDTAQLGDSGRDFSGQSSDQGAHGQKQAGLTASAHDNAPQTAGFASAGGLSLSESSGIGLVQSGGAVSDNALSRAIMNVQYALTGSASGRTGPATAAEMRFQSLGQQVLAALRANSHDIELTLNPAQLGQVVLKLNVDGSKVRVSARTESKMTDEALKAGEAELKASLLAQGFILDGFDVSHDDDRRRTPKAETEGAAVAQSQDGEAFSIDLIA